MFRKPLKTYDRKKHVKLNYSSILSQYSTIPSHNEESKTNEKESFNDTLADPFDTTFDRLLKDTKAHPVPQPISGLSYVDSSFELSDNPSTPKILTPNSESNSPFAWNEKVIKKKARFKRQNPVSERLKKIAIRPPRVVKEKAAVKTENKEAKQTDTQNNEKSDQQKRNLRAKRKRRLSNDSDDNLTNFITTKKQNISENSYKNNIILEGTSIFHTPDSINSSTGNFEDNNLKNIDTVQKSLLDKEKSENKNNEFSPSNRSLSSKGSCPSKRSFNSVINSKTISTANLKACSVVLEPCDWMLKKKEVLKLKPCSVQIPRLNIKSYLKTKKSSIIQDVKKEKRISEGSKVKKPQEGSKNILKKGSRKNQGNKFENNESIMKENNSVKLISRVNESPVCIKNCVVNLTRMNPLKGFFSGRLISSTPFVKGKNGNLSARFSPIPMDMSNIASPIDLNKFPISSKVSSVSLGKLKETPAQFEGIKKSNDNFKSNLTSNADNTWNYSSEYSEIDWTTVSLSDSKFEKEVDLQKKQNSRSHGNQIRELKSINIEGTKNDSINKDLSATIELTNKNVDTSTKVFKFVTKRNLDLNFDYEKSTSIFDDTKISENVESVNEIISLKLDKKSLQNSSPSSSHHKLPSLSEKPMLLESSILNQSDFLGFENDIPLSYMKKLSPMTEIPTSIVNSLSLENSKKCDSIAEDLKVKSKRTKFQSPAIGKLLNLKSPRKCLNFEDEPKDAFENESSNSISSNKEFFNKKSTLTESLKESFSQDSCNNNTFNQESFTNDCTGESSKYSQFESTASSTNSPLKVENSQTSEKNKSSILLTDGEGMNASKNTTLSQETLLTDNSSQESSIGKYSQFESTASSTNSPLKTENSQTSKKNESSLLLTDGEGMNASKNTTLSQETLLTDNSQESSIGEYSQFESTASSTNSPLKTENSQTSEKNKSSILLTDGEGMNASKNTTLSQETLLTDNSSQESSIGEYSQFESTASSTNSPLKTKNSQTSKKNESSILLTDGEGMNASQNTTLSQETLLTDNSTQDSSSEEYSHFAVTPSPKNSPLKTENTQPLEINDSILLVKDGEDNSDIKNESRICLEELYENPNSLIVEKQIPENKTVNVSEIRNKKSINSPNRLRDSTRITNRRKEYRNWSLAAISENESERVTRSESEISPPVDPVEDVDSICDTVSLISNASFNNDKEKQQPEHLFLKPGKSWARSLSILSNIHSKDDVDKLSVGKGKKWRNSVISILDMQNKGIVQSCFKHQEDLKSLKSCGVNVNVGNDLKFERFSTFGSVSPNRFVKRISIRVVPDVKKVPENVGDTQFLEAYGITSSQHTKTLSQRFSSLEENSNFIAKTQESLIYNVQLEDSVIKSVDSSPLVTAKDVVLEKCRQEDYLPFAQCYPETFLKHCRKIGEGVYGEVFLYENELNMSVIKIIPIEGNILVNGERQKKFHEILSEIVIAKELHDLRFNETYNTSAFVEVKSIKCIIGRYPKQLIELWKSYDDEKKSENDCPSIFDNNQLYISLELGHGGQDLEAFVFQNANESYAVFIQTAFALAVAEKSLEFEHRDLHWGNVLISRSKKSQVSYKIGNNEISFPSNGVKVAIIDFTLSRMSYQGCCIFNDLALDPALFTAEGEYQFEIYRLMRDKLGNNWQTFEPFTNILWLHYTLDKMIKLVRYKKKTTKVHKGAIERLKELKDEILSYDSAYDLVTKCDKFTSLYGDFKAFTLDSENKSL